MSVAAGNLDTDYNYDVFPGEIGTSGGQLPGTASAGVSGATVIGVSTTDGDFQPVSDSGTTVDGYYISLTVNPDGSDSTTLLGNEAPESSGWQNAANGVNLTADATDTFYYEVQTGGTTTTDQVTWTFGDVYTTVTSGLQSGQTVTGAAGTDIPLAGISIEKIPTVIGGATTDESTAPLSVSVSLSSGTGTLSVDGQQYLGYINYSEEYTYAGATLRENAYGFIQISGTESQINAALSQLEYTNTTQGDAGNITVATVDDSNTPANGGYYASPSSYAQVDINCFRAGTRILTERGEVAIEDLVVGDAVTIARQGSQATRPVAWTGHRKIDCKRHPKPHAIWPVVVRRGAFGEGLPSRDLRLSPGHSVYVKGVLLQIENLVNDRTIFQEPCEEVDYWHVELDSHDILLAEGLPCESYLETGNRKAFIGGASFLELHPDFQPKHWSETCVPLILKGEEIARAKAALLARAAALGYAVTSDDDLHVLADGRRIEPVRLAARRVAFMLPPGCSDICLQSRTFIPKYTMASSRDTRVLGACVGQLQLDGVAVALDDQSIFAGAAGWNGVEWDGERPCRRWTAGSATLPSGARLVVINLAARGHYWAESDDADSVKMRASA